MNTLADFIVMAARYEPPNALAAAAILLGLFVIGAIRSRFFSHKRPLSRRKPEGSPRDDKQAK